jgi:HlyD family secretion protein
LGDHLPPGFQGIVELDERVIACEVPGRVGEVAVRRGDAVVDGAEVAKLDDTLARLTHDAREQDEASARAELALLQAGTRREDIASAAAEVRGAMAQVTLARKTATHVLALSAAGSIAGMEVDKANADLARTSAEQRALEQKLRGLEQGARPEEITRAQARLASLTLETALEAERLERHVVRARGAGMVVDVSVEPGELAAVGTPVHARCAGMRTKRATLSAELESGSEVSAALARSGLLLPRTFCTVSSATDAVRFPAPSAVPEKVSRSVWTT